ncbi:hypothetical protein D3C85_1604500 [compost metagenome]
MTKDHTDLVQRQIQFFGNNLSQRSTDPGAQVHVAVERIDLAIVIDRKEQR